MTKRSGDRTSELHGGKVFGRTEAGAPSVLRPETVRLMACCALFLMMLGARWWMIDSYGSDVPWLDQWYAEAELLFKPYHDGTLTAKSWFGPHNEHRILFTRIFALGLMLANGQWDPRLEMAVNAVLYAFVACGLFWVLSRDRQPRFMLFLTAVLAVIFTFPYSATNTLLGFQSQFYFLAGFSIIAIYALLNSRSGSLFWLGGVLSGGAALFTMGSGLTGPLVVLAVLAVLAVRSRRGWSSLLRERWMTIAAASLLVAAGYYLSVSPTSHLRQAHSAGEFAAFLLKCLAWPGKRLVLHGNLMIIVAVITWLPFAVFCADMLSGRAKDGSRERFVLGMGFWVLLQAAALSFYRGNSAEGLESRYMDILGFGLIANVMCAVWLIDGTRRGRLILLLTIVWLTVNGFGLYAVSFNGRLLNWKQGIEHHRALTAAFAATEDPSYLSSPWLRHDNPKRLGSTLLDPAIHPVLPVGIRKSLILVPSQGSSDPSLIRELSLPDGREVTPGAWNWTGIYSRFAVIRAPSRFEYHVVKEAGLPFLMLYFSGGKENLSVSDSRRIGRSIRLFPGGAARTLHPAFVFCPTETCTFTGRADQSEFVLMEPKEIGFLSIVTLFAVAEGSLIFYLGILLFALLILLLFVKKNTSKGAADWQWRTTKRVGRRVVHPASSLFEIEYEDMWISY